MFYSLILSAIIFGGAYYFINKKYEQMIKVVSSVQAAKNKLLQEITERHKIVSALMKASEEHSLFNEDLDVLPSLKKRIKDARELDEEDKLIKAEEELTLTLDSLENFMMSHNHEALQKLTANMKAYNQKYKQGRDKYNDAVEQYEEMGEDFVNSIMIAVFEKKLCFKFTYWEISEDDEFSGDGDGDEF